MRSMRSQAATQDARADAKARAETDDAAAEEGDGMSKARTEDMSDVQLACCIAR